MSEEVEVETIRISPRAAKNKIKALQAEIAKLKKEIERMKAHPLTMR